MSHKQPPGQGVHPSPCRFSVVRSNFEKPGALKSGLSSTHHHHRRCRSSQKTLLLVFCATLFFALSFTFRLLFNPNSGPTLLTSYYRRHRSGIRSFSDLCRLPIPFSRLSTAQNRGLRLDDIHSPHTSPVRQARKPGERPSCSGVRHL
jgi:hypothetical protein